VIDRSLLILEDWAHNVSFDPVEIDKERGVVLEEWRLGLGAGERIQDTQFPILLKRSFRMAESRPYAAVGYAPRTMSGSFHSVGPVLDWLESKIEYNADTH